MIRHIFIGTFKEGISDEIKQKELVMKGYAAARSPGGVTRMSVQIGGRIEQQDIVVRGHAGTKEAGIEQRMTVEVKGG